MKLTVAHVFKKFVAGEIQLFAVTAMRISNPRNLAVRHTNVQGSHFKAPPLIPVLSQLNPPDILCPISVIKVKKSKVAPVLNLLSATPLRRMESGCIDPHFLDLGTNWRGVVSFTPRPLYPRGKSLLYPLDRRLGGLQGRSGRRGEDKILDPTGTPTPTSQSSSP
jgi:hypothetical protein